VVLGVLGGLTRFCGDGEGLRVGVGWVGGGGGEGRLVVAPPAALRPSAEW
jgi:hypothetical protein